MGEASGCCFEETAALATFSRAVRSPSIRSEASSSNSSSFRDVDFLSPESSSTYFEPIEDAVGNSHKLSRKLVWISDFSPAFCVEDVVFASTELLGRGTFGSAYTAVVGNGVRIVVKRLKSVSVHESEFRRHMGIVGNVRYENLAPLMAYYSSKDERLLLYDYYSKNVYALLHGKAARGIAHIQEQDGGKLVHGSIKSSNIFLDEQKYGIISDTGIGEVTGPVKQSSIRSSSDWAPKVTDTKKISQASDVFSFGVILLELVSGRPSQLTDYDGETVSLVKWIQSVTRDEWTAEVIDIELMMYQNDEETLMQLLEIAMDCVSIPSTRKPKMFEVVRMLEEISGIEVEPSIESGVEYRGGGLSIQSILEDLLPKLIV